MKRTFVIATALACLAAAAHAGDDPTLAAEKAAVQKVVQEANVKAATNATASTSSAAPASPAPLACPWPRL